MKDAKDYFEIGTEHRRKLDENILRDLNFNGGVKEFFLTLRVKLSQLEKVEPEDIHIMEFRGNCYNVNIPDSIEVVYAVYTFYNKNEIEKAYRGYIESIGGVLNDIKFSSGSNCIWLDITVPKSMAAKIDDHYGRLEFGHEIKKSYPGFYPNINLCARFV